MNTPSDPPAPIIEHVLYLDRIDVLLASKPTPEELATLRRTGALRSPEAKPYNVCRQYPWRITLGRGVTDNQLDALNRMVFQRGGVVTYFEIALNLLTLNNDHARRVARWMASRVVVLYRRVGPLVRHRGNKGYTIYWSPKDDCRNFVVYFNRLCKITRRDNAHCEVRIRSAEACRNLGVREPLDLTNDKLERIYRCVVEFREVDEVALGAALLRRGGIRRASRRNRRERARDLLDWIRKHSSERGRRRHAQRLSDWAKRKGMRLQCIRLVDLWPSFGASLGPRSDKEP